MKLSCLDVLKEKNINECNISNLVLEYYENEWKESYYNNISMIPLIGALFVLPSVEHFHPVW